MVGQTQLDRDSSGVVNMVRGEPEVSAGQGRDRNRERLQQNGDDEIKSISERVQQNRDSKHAFTCRYKKGALLNFYSETGKLLNSCERAGTSHQCHYRWLREDDVYAAEFEEAQVMAADKFEGDIVHRGFERDRPSDLLAMFHMKKLRPEYRDNFTIDINHTHTISVDDAKQGIAYLLQRNPNLIEQVQGLDTDIVDVECETDPPGPPNEITCDE